MRFVHRDTVGSTQDEARALYIAGERGPLWLSADEQTQGRGRLGRHWSSPTGNFAATCLHPTTAEPGQAALYGFAASLAVAETIERYRPARPVTLKWPNDVLVGGAKISGLLIEREAQALLVGIGVNLVGHPANTPYPATHLVAEMHAFDLEGPEPLFTGAPAFLALLAREVAQRFLQLEKGSFERIRRDWLIRAHGLGEELSVNDVTGLFTDLAPDGALCLRLADGTESRVHAGDVSFG